MFIEMSPERVREIIFSNSRERIYPGAITWIGLDEDEEYVDCLIAAEWVEA